MSALIFETTSNSVCILNYVKSRMRLLDFRLKNYGLLLFLRHNNKK